MKKEEIKKDLIHDKIVNSINFITNNPSKFWTYFGVFALILVCIVFYNSSNDKQLNDYNSYSSINQNNYIDNNKEVALLGFENILDNYSSSESYNQAFIYMLSEALINNDLVKVDALLETNKFSTQDDYLNSQFYKLKADYCFTQNKNDESIDLYNKSIKYSNISDHQAVCKINIINILLDQNKPLEAKKITSEIDVDNLSYAIKNKFNEVKVKINYLTNWLYVNNYIIYDIIKVEIFSTFLLNKEY